MTEYTRPATWEDVKAVARHLEAAGAEYALVGGYALGAHGFNRSAASLRHALMSRRLSAQRRRRQRGGGQPHE